MHRITCVALLLLVSTAVIAQEPETYTTDNDPLSVVSRAPGAPDGSIFAGFENNENVSLSNGNLLIGHPSSPTFPMDGGMSVGLTRSYNSKSVFTAEVHQSNEPNPEGPNNRIYRKVFQGESWVGVGWTMHLGRLMRKSRYTNSDYVPDRYFEDSSGTQHSLEHGPAAHPRLEWQFVAQQTQTKKVCENGDPYGGDSCCVDNPPICPPWTYTCNCWDESTTIPEHYELTYPDGTTYYLEEMVTEQWYGDFDWIRNSSRAGWYATKITDLHGNEIRVEYWGAGNPYPEAIKEVWLDPADVGEGDPTPQKVIWTELWSSEDNGLDLDYNSVADGMLKFLHAMGPDGTTVTYKFVYDNVSVSDDGGPNASYQTFDVATLIRVDLPSIGGSPAGDVDYAYSGGSPTPPRLYQVTYPMGGVSEYGYTSYVAGRRNAECAFEDIPGPGGLPPEQCNYWHERRETGVAQRTIYPDGKPQGSETKPYSTWQWYRRFWNDGPQCCCSEDNEFRMTAPDGTVQISKMYGDPCGLSSLHGPDGREETRVIYSDTTATTPYRTYSYDYVWDFDGGAGGAGIHAVQQKREMVTFHDDPGEEGKSCFDSTLGLVGTRTQESYNQQLDLDKNWTFSRLEGDYIKNRRVQWTSVNTPQCQRDQNVLHLYDSIIVEEGSQRTEANYTFDCDGQLTAFRAKDELVTTVTPPPADPTDYDQWELWTINPVAADDLDDVVHTLSYSTNGNLKAIDFTGGDDRVDGNKNAYHVDYTWEYGRAETVSIPSLGYNSREIAADAAGYVTSAIDPNGLTSSFEFDALGRVTKIAPPSENPTRIVYPSLTETRIIQSVGTETTLIADGDQLYSEQHYDGLGRTIEAKKVMPDGSLSAQYTRYDMMGRAIFVSEWLSPADVAAANWPTWSDASGDYFVDYPENPTTSRPWGTTSFFGTPDALDPDNPLKADPDPLGRVREVRKADGSKVSKNYCGPHEEVIVHDACIGTKDDTTCTTQDVKTRYYNDGLGRLVAVDSPPGGADAFYEYGIRGNLTKVTLVDAAPADPFAAWLGDTYPAGQTREFKYDALGRLKESTNPENGKSYFDRYDTWGNLLASRDAMARDRGYLFENVYDAAGRITDAKRLVGTVNETTGVIENLQVGDSDLLSGSGSFESSLTGWTEGTISGNTFTDLGSSWTWAVYANLSCINPPPDNPTSVAGAYLGANCSYDAVPAAPQALRIQLNGVGKDDVLTFRYWRQTRQAAEGDDEFSVFVVPASAGNDVSTKRYLLKVDDHQTPYSTWRQSPPMHLSSVLSALPENVYLYFVFEKGDADTGLGAGLFIDDVIVGRKATELLAQYAYDQDACGGTDPATDACAGGSEPANRYKGQLTKETSYLGGDVVAEKTLAYKGLDGRLSGQRMRIDPFGVSQMVERTTRWEYRPTGLVSDWLAPYAPGTAIDPGRNLSYAHKRGALIGIDVTNTTEVLLDPSNGGAVDYNPAGGFHTIRFPNGSSTVIDQDVLYRPKKITVNDPESPGTSFWTSGDYAYDGAGNITQIGSQRFLYDQVGRLTRAEMLPQAGDPGDSTLAIVGYSYDTYGNMTERTWSRSGDPNIPLGMVFNNRTYTNNQIVSDNSTIAYAYDTNGNMTRLKGSNEIQTGAVWDARNRMLAYYNNDPDAGGLVSERYLYDASAYRVWRQPETTGDGKPHLYVRDGSGQLLSEFVVNPGSGGQYTVDLEKDFVYGLGHLLVERRVSDDPPSIVTHSTFESNSQYGFEFDGAIQFGSYLIDIRTDSGYINQISGVVPDANGVFWLDEADFAIDETNEVRVRGESGQAEPYSEPVTVTIDSSVMSTSENQVRTMSVTRDGTDLTMRWQQLTPNGKSTYLYFDRADGGGTIPLTPFGIAPGITEYTIASHALSSPKGNIYATQMDAQLNETSGNGAACVPTTVGGGSVFGSSCDPDPDPPGPNPNDLQFASSWHHRDHLGSLRVLSDVASDKLDTHDFYPFGMELVTTGEALGPSFKMYTGHERDEQTGLDYMMARYCGPQLGRFASVDPIYDVSEHEPGTWNRYGFVHARPMIANDPTGEAATLVTGAAGAGIGALVAGAGELIRQKVAGEEVNWRKVAAASGGGFVSGGLAGLTMGGSLVGQGLGGVALVGGASNIVGGVVERGLDGDDSTVALDPLAMTLDGTAGAVGGAAGNTAGKAARTIGSGQDELLEAQVKRQQKNLLRPKRTALPKRAAFKKMDEARRQLQTRHGVTLTIDVVAGAKTTNMLYRVQADRLARMAKSPTHPVGGKPSPSPCGNLAGDVNCKSN